MRAVTSARAALGRLRTIALATALACTASGAHAGFASVVIDGVVISSSSDSDTFLFAPLDTMNQAWDLQVLVDGVIVDQNANSLPNWDPSGATAQDPNAVSTVSTYQFTDPLTQLITPGFALTATANVFPDSSLRTAVGNMFSSGTFCFWDSVAPPPGFDGTSSFCNGTGSLTFTVFYDLIISPLNSNYAEINILGNGVPGGSFVDYASTTLGIGSKEDQSFTWTANLTPGNFASFDVAGIVVAEAIPEPGVLSLLAVGLLGLFVTRRRSGIAALRH